MPPLAAETEGSKDSCLTLKSPPTTLCLGGREVRDVLEYVRGKWLSVAVEYRDSVHDSPQQVWVIEALSSLELQVVSFADVGHHPRAGCA